MAYYEPHPIIFVCIPAAQNSAQDGTRVSQSFEEARMTVYLRSYRLTGRPPPPCPVEPSVNAERAALGLPPRFSPWTVVQQPLFFPRPPALGANEDMVRYPPEQLPRIQVHASTRIGGEVYENITCAPTYAWYSVEELRHFAYSQGLQHAVVPIPTPPIAQAPTTVSATPTLVFDDQEKETLEHISTHPSFLKHSPEELRLAFIRTGRELNSQQLNV
ncbi:hypothetical protein APHAL10511_003580 [Amanita phalloides]|nr:hypothetical protein APHAL10511_003580 [Amanita phalloides]